MFLRINILLLSFLFAANLWLSVNYEGYSGWFGIIFSLVIIIASRLVTKRWKFTVLPALLVVGAVLLLSLIDFPIEMNAFILFSSMAFYVSVLGGWRIFHYEKDETAKAMYNIATIAAVFCWYSSSYGWYLNPGFSFPVWMLVAIFSIITFLISFVSFSVNQIDAGKRLVYSVFMTILIAQVIWVQNFWPFGYLTTSVIALIIFFVGWEMILNFFLRKFTVRTVVFEIVFLVVSASLILLSTKWYPVI